MTTNDLIKLAVDLWPRWTVTESIADLMASRFEELDGGCVEKAIRDHRLARSTVPDIGVIVSSAKAIHDARVAAERHKQQAEAWRPREADIRDARASLGAMDEAKRLWLWRYCRNMARLEVPWSELEGWPPHWTKTAPPMADWPQQVLGAFHMMRLRLGI